MDTEEKFYQQDVDRSKRGALVWVVLFVLAYYLIAATLLWNLASYLKHRGWNFGSIHFSTQAPAISLPSNLPNQLQQQAADKAKRAEQQAAQDAFDQAKSQLQQALSR